MHTVEALDRLILFRQKPDSLLRRLMATEEAVRVAAQGELVALAVENGWQGDLWRCCIAQELVSSENPFSLAWERRSNGQDTLKALALADMKLFFELLNRRRAGRGRCCGTFATRAAIPRIAPRFWRSAGNWPPPVLRRGCWTV